MLQVHIHRFIRLWIILFVIISAVCIWIHRHVVWYKLSTGIVAFFVSIPQAIPELLHGYIFILAAFFLIRRIYH